MVMHARKCPKLNDGYYNRNEARPYENMDKYPSSKSRGGSDRYRSDRYYDDSPSPAHNSYHDDDDSPPSDRERDRDRDRDRASPRYSNKASYMDKSRSRLHDRGTSRSPGEKRSNHVYQRNGPIRNARDSRDTRDSYRDSRSRDRDSRDRESRERDSYRDSRDFRDSYRNSQSRLSNSRDSSYRDGPPGTRDPPIKRLHDAARDQSREGRESRDNHVVKETKETSHTKKDVRAEVQKTALRVCGDWSEHTSSSGKTFYYNCKQNVSKWEKPKDWNDDDCIIPEHIKKQNAAKAAAEEKRHSSSGHVQQASTRSQQRTSSLSDSQSSSKLRTDPDPVSSSSSANHHSNHKNNSTSNNSSSSHGNQARSGSTPGGYHDNRAGSRTPNASSTSANTTPSHSAHSAKLQGALRSDRGAPTSLDSSQRTAASQNSVSQNGRSEDSGLSRLSESRDEDMDVSSDGTPTDTTASAGCLATGTPTIATSSSGQKHSAAVTTATTTSPSNAVSTETATTTLPQLVSKLGDTCGQSMNSQELTQQDFLHWSPRIQTQQALQTLQKLQQALTQRAALKPNVNNQSPDAQSADTPSPFTSPQQRHRSTSDATNPSQVEDMVCDGDSPRSDASFRSSRYDPWFTSREGRRSKRCSSPAPSPVSSTGVPLGVCGLSTNQQAQTVDLTPSLGKYYDEKLIGHVKGWPADHLARQADMHMYEAHTVGSLHCTQVSADLKKARSLVRIAEIQSTLQEQRILFLIQQVKDLENTKGQGSFMPT